MTYFLGYSQHYHFQKSWNFISVSYVENNVKFSLYVHIKHEKDLIYLHNIKNGGILKKLCVTVHDAKNHIKAAARENCSADTITQQPTAKNAPICSGLLF